MTFLEFAFANLKRRPARTLLTILGVTLAIGTAVALLALGRGIAESVEQGLDEQGAEMVVMARSATDVISARLPGDMAAELASMEGVEAVAGTLMAFTVVGEGNHVLVSGWDPASQAWRDVPLSEGRMPEPGAREVVVGDVIADTLQLQVGSEVLMFEEPFTVVGLTEFDTAMNRGLTIAPLSVLQEASLREGQVTYFSVRLDPELGAQEAEAVRQAIAEALPVTVSNAEEVMEGDRNTEVLESISTAISIVALVMGGLSLLGTLLLSVQERTREIGMMTAMGWSDMQVVGLIVVEGLVMGLAGCAGGVVLGIASSSFFGSLPALGDLIEFTPRAADLALPLAFAVPLCVLGASYPAWRAVRMLPAEALRSV
ncbi:ABC transporter permease [Afifella pfennigii]|uniref:ABC transporter permease n=1 Tax=Afifella pfennigii TaxID=209897 RepID=UPI00047BB391|nr:ABC transporter permease [Afifella pfennigii]